MSNLNPNNGAIIGIDVSKDKLDVYFLETGQRACWENDIKHIAKAVRCLKQEGFKGLVVLEATGGYEQACQQQLNKAGIQVHVAHPRRVHHFMQQKGYYGKTDKIDAKGLAEYGYQESPEPTAEKDKASLERQALSARRAQVVEMLTAEKCRLKDHLPTSVRRSIRRLIKSKEAELKLLEAALEKGLEQDESLKQKAKRLQSFKGVGPITTVVLLSALPELGQLDRKAIACLCGLAPRNRDSGRMSQKRRVSGGRSHVRKTLYMAALAAITHNPVMKAFYQHLKQTGKASKVCLTAVMRKIVITLNAMIRDNQDWNEKANAASLSPC